MIKRFCENDRTPSVIESNFLVLPCIQNLQLKLIICYLIGSLFTTVRHQVNDSIKSRLDDARRQCSEQEARADLAEQDALRLSNELHAG